MNPYILVVFGLLLIFLEFYVPGAVLGILGGILIISSVVIFSMQDHSAIEIFLFLIVVGFSLGFLIKYTLQRIPKAKPGRSIYLKTDQEGYVASQFDAKQVGKKGVVLTDLKPSGFILIEGRQYQALSQAGYIVRGTGIIVIGGKGAHLIVKLETKEKE